MSRLDIGDKVLCVNASIEPHMKEEIEKDFEMWLKQGNTYTIRGFNENDGIVVGVLLEEIYNFPKYFKLLGRSQEPSFRLDRFRKRQEDEVTAETEVEEAVQVS